MKNTEKKLIARLDEVALGNLDKASFKALLRLQVYFTGRTHELMIEFGKQAQAVLLRHGDEDGLLDGARGFRAQTDLLKTWGDVFKQWSDEFMAARREAASLPFGVLAVRHERLLVESQKSKVEERIASGLLPLAMTEAIEDGVFKPQIDILLNAAAEHLYGDTLNLSARIWRIDGGGREAINNVIMQGIANGDSAWNIAKKLEEFLGAGMDCPRWTSTRLYGRTASDKSAGDTTGLLSGNDCDGRGVSYNALRLVRTEIQKAHALATNKAMAAQPWVKSQQFILSRTHKETDECDEAASGTGEFSGLGNDDGTYPVGTIEIPLHPNCFCFMNAVMTDEKEFTSQLNGWLNGESFPEMDEYKSMIGWDGNGSGDPFKTVPSLMNDAFSLAVWLFGDEDKLKGLLQWKS